VSCEWSTGPELYYSCLSACLTGYDGAACPHVLQAIIAQVSGDLETCEPTYIGRHVLPSFIHEAGHVAASETSPVGRRGLES
jgi:hypothetical protein